MKPGMCLLCFGLVLTACVAPAQVAPAPSPLPTTAAGATQTPARATVPAVSTSAPPISGVLVAAWDAPSNTERVRSVDPATGQEVVGSPHLALGPNLVFAFSTHGDRLAIVDFHHQVCDSYLGGSRCRASDGVLHLFEVGSWHEITATLPAQAWVVSLTFSADARRLAIGYGQLKANGVLLVNGGTAATLATRPLDFPPTLLRFNQEGSRLVAFGAPPGVPDGMAKPGAPHALLLDGQTLAVLWDHALPHVTAGFWCEERCQGSEGEYGFADWTPATALSPDGSRLYIVHADADRLTTVDFASRRVATMDFQARQSWLKQFLSLGAGMVEAKGISNGAQKGAALSADGRQLYVIGQAMKAAADPRGTPEPSQTWLGLKKIDLSSGQVLAANLQAQGSEIRLLPGGENVLLSGYDRGEPFSEAFDANTLGSRARLDGWQVQAGRRSDDSSVLLATRPGPQSTQLAALDPRSFAVGQSWKVPNWAFWLTQP